MTLLDTVNVGGSDYGYLAVTVLGSCATPAGTEIKQASFSDNFQLRAGVSIAVQFTYANTYGDGSATYPKLRVNGTDYPIKFSNGDYAGDGAWDNGQIVAFMFDGTNLIAGAGSGGGSSGGVPLGTVIAVYSNTVPNGYLPCNGVQFDTTQFPALYGLLGDDHTPDLRECAITGIGKNTTDIFDSTETDPSTGLAGTQTHDVFTLGEFKDDQLQDHWHELLVGNARTVLTTGGEGRGYSFASGAPDGARADNITQGRHGSVTRGKRKGLNLCIKALSGLDPSQQDYILNQMNEQRSYSTTEHPTGKKWIDGKPIYSKTFYSATGWTSGVLVGTIDNFDKIMSVITAYTDANNNSSCNYSNPISGDEVFTVYFNKTYNGLYTVVNNINMVEGYITIEYTKTTPST